MGNLSKANDNRLFYGYIIVIASFFIIFVMHGFHSTYGVFFSSLQAEFGWNRTLVSGAYSLEFFLEGVFATMGGRLTDRFGPRAVMIAYALILGLAYFLMSRVNALWQLYVFWGIIVGLGTSIGNVSLLSTTARWFIKRRAFMSGIVKVGTGAGIFVMPLLVTWLIVSYGWRNAFVIAAIICVVGIVAGAQFLRRDPAQKGLQPLGAGEPGAGDSFQAGEGLSPRQAIRTRQFWMTCAMYFIAWYCAMTIQVHIVPHALGIGFTAAQAAGILSAVGAVSIIGRIVMGGAGDRLGSTRALVICYLILAISLVWLQFAHDFWALLLFTIPYGFAHGGFFALVSPVFAELFGTKSHGSVFGVALLFSQTGGAVGPLVAGRIFDVAGSYQLAFLILVFVAVAGLAISIQLNRSRPLGRSAGALP